MSREIKFRAWDGSRIRSWEDITLTLGFHHFLWNKELDIELMQFTGLKDKKGKEIYEGDIIHYGYYENKDKNGLELLDKPMNFKVWWEQLSCSWCANGRLVAYNGIYPFKIIGNIYENPELIE